MENEDYLKRKDAIERILECLPISDAQIDLVGKVLDLEKDTERVQSVKLRYGTLGYSGLSLEVNLLPNKNFDSVDEFKAYLTLHGFPETNAWRPSNEPWYFRFNYQAVAVGFSVPE